MTGNIKYWTSVLTDEQATTVAETFCTAMRCIIEGSDRTFGSLGWLNQVDESTVATWNNTSPSVVDMCVHSLFEEQVLLCPEATAASSWDGELTYRELNTISNHLASQLVSHGVGPGIMIPLCFEKSMWMIVAMLAVLKAGAACVPMVPEHPDARLAGVLQETEARVVLVSETQAARFTGLAEQPISVGHSIMDQHVEKHGNIGSSAAPTSLVQPSDLAVVIFTSGSTGKPKGVLLEHRALCTSMAAHGKALSIGPSSRVLQFASFTFDISLQDILTTLTRGGCVCMPSEHDRVNDLTSVINRMHVNWASLTPTVAMLLEPQSVPGLKTLTLAGEAVTAQLIDVWGGVVDLHNCYGPAESTIYCAWQGELGRGRLPSDIGKALATTLWVADAIDYTRPAPIGAVGELLVQGPTLARGYLDHEQAVGVFIELPSWIARLQTESPWRRTYRTGDLVRYNEDGSLVYFGRKDTQVKVRGQRVELGEIEYAVANALTQCPHVAVDAVHLGNSGSRGQVVAAFLEEAEYGGSDDQGRASNDTLLPASTELNEKYQSLRAALTARLPGYMVPQVFFPVHQMPLTSSGKVDRRKLRELVNGLDAEALASYSQIRGEKREPSTEAERCLQDLWERLLELQPGSVRADDDFFQLGGDSVDAMRLVVAASEAGWAVTVGQIFRKPQLSLLAAEVKETAERGGVPEDEDAEPFTLLGCAGANEVAVLVNEVAQQLNLPQESVKDVYPCTSLQEGLMALAATSPKAYMAQHTFRLAPQVDVDRLKESWARVAAECDILCTRIVYIDGKGPLQVVLREQITWHEGTSLQEYLSQDRQKPMNYGTPLSRVAIASGDDESLYLVWTAQHAIYDGWSASMLLERVEQTYARDSSSPKPLPVPFSRFIKHLTVSDAHASDEYWRQQLHGWSGAPFPRLPSTVHQTRTTKCMLRHFFLSEPSTAGVTNATILQAGWAVVLSRQTGSNDVIFGLTLSGRSAQVSGISRIAGPTITTVPRRIQLQGDSTVSELLRAVQSDAADMMPYEQAGLHRIQALTADAHKACQFQSLLAVQPARKRRIDVNDDDTAILLTPQVDASDLVGFHTYPLVVECRLRESSTEVELEAQYDEAVLSRAEVQRLIEQLTHATQQLARAEPKVSIASLDMLSPQDAARIQSWNSVTPTTTVECVHNLVEGQVTMNSAAAAISAWDGELSYGEMNLLSDRLAAHLTSLGVGHESKVPIHIERSKWVVIAILAVLKTGASFVPLDAAAPYGRLEQVVEATHATIALSGSQKHNPLASVVPTVVEVSAPAAETWPAVKGLGRLGEALSKPTDVAYITFTSGSTGKPKGVVMDHQAVCSSMRAHGNAMHFTPSSRVLHFASLGFDASVAEILTTLIHGGCICIPDEEQRLTNITEAINQYQVNWAFFTPSVISLISPSEVPCLKTLVLGGERVKRDNIQVWADNVQLINGYGPTEACVFCVATALSTAQPQSDIIGKAIGSTSWVVSLGNEAQLAAIGAVGELWIEGPQLARGYLGEDSLTAAAFIRNPPFLQPQPQVRTAYRTGDLVRYNDDGSLRYFGRRDGQVKVRGQRVELLEIEHQLLANELVEAGMILFPQQGPFASRVTAVISLAEHLGAREQASGGAETTNGFTLLQGTHSHLMAARLKVLKARQALVEALPSFMIPAAWLVVGSIPLTSAGKLDRFQAMEWVRGMNDDQARAAALLDSEDGTETNDDGLAAEAVTPMELTLREACSEVLGLPSGQISMARSFLSHGGDSITAMQLASRLRAKKLRASVQDILRSQSLSRLALLVGTIEKSSIPRDEPLNRAFDLSPIQQLYFGLDEDAANVRFNQSFFVRLTRRKEVHDIARALEALVSQHSMLRASFGIDDSGRWRQTVTAQTQTFEFTVHDVSQDRAADQIAAIVAATQSRINPQTGPIFAINLFEVQGAADSEHAIAAGQVLFLVASHLVIDLVSWRIILQQFEDLLETGRLSAERPIPFQVWIKLQKEYAQVNLTPEASLPPELPVPDLDYWGLQGRRNVYGDVESISFELGETVTRLLLDDCNAAFQTDPVDLFTTALLHSFRQVFDRATLPTIFSEGHGREPWDAEIDISGTVGWFTTLRPLIVQASKDDDCLLRLLRQAKDARHATPSNGWAYFASRYLHPRGQEVFELEGVVEIMFNYLGRFQQLERKGSLLQQEPRVGGLEAADVGPDTCRMAAIEVSASVQEGRLKMGISYSTRARHTEQIVTWAHKCEQTLVTMSQLLPSRRREYTISDLPLLKLTQAGLDQLVHDRLPGIGIKMGEIEQIEDIYPCSTIQHGMLVSQTKIAAHYKTAFAFEATSRASSVDVGRLVKAWQAVVDRHAMLRTVFINGVQSDDAFIQVVLKKAEANVVLSSMSRRPEEKEEEEEKKETPGLAIRPDHRLIIDEAESGRVECVLEINHALVDGASVPILFGDLAQAYEGELSSHRGPLYRDYIAHLLTSPRDAAVDYWAEHLLGLEPCRFPRLADSIPQRPEVRTADLDLNDMAAEIQAFCAANDATVANIVHATWAIMLRTYTGSEDVCFGYLTSGRDVPVSGVEGVVGPLINILTARRSVQAGTCMSDMAAADKAAHLQSLPYQSCSLARVQHKLGLAGQALFNTVVSVRTHLADTQQASELSFRGLRGHDPTEVRLFPICYGYGISYLH